MAKKATPAELWAMVEEIAAEVERRIPVEPHIEHRIEHRQQLTKLHTAFWKLFRGWSR